MENGYLSDLFYVDIIPSTKFDLYVAQIVLFFSLSCRYYAVY